MALLTDPELAAYRAALAETFTDTAVILRRVDVADGAGGTEPDWPEVGTYPCRLWPQGMQAFETTDKTLGRTVSTTVWFLALAAGVDVRPQDRVRVGTRTFEVSGSRGGRSLELQTVLQLAEIL